MFRVYIAGPTAAETIEKELENIQKAMEAAYKLVAAGMAVYLPHAFWFVDRHIIACGGIPLGNLYLKQDLEWLRDSDMMLCLPGKSSGTEKEKEYASRYSIPICMSVEEVISP